MTGIFPREILSELHINQKIDCEAFYWQIHLFMKQDTLIGSRKVSQKASLFCRPCLASLEFPELTIVKKIQGW